VILAQFILTLWALEKEVILGFELTACALQDRPQMTAAALVGGLALSAKAAAIVGFELQ
jgi:hypothetical protein